MVIFQIFIKENRGSFSTCLSKLRFFGKPTHSVVVCVVVDAYSKSIDGIKLWEQSMCHVDAVPCANFNTSVHLQSGNYLNKHAQPI